MRNKVGVVVQRYGLEITGGAELQSRLFAERLVSYGYDVHVITTKAMDHRTWKNKYRNQYEEIAGVKVHRFPVKGRRDRHFFSYTNQFVADGLPKEKEEEWIRKQGPYVPELVDYISRNREEYDVFLFFTYLYYPTIYGMRDVYQKSVLIPEAHDEPFIRMNCMKDLFCKPAAIFYNTPAEQRMVECLFRNGEIRSDIGGIGIDPLPDTDGERFKKKHGLDRYFLYAGRIEEAKNCSELFRFFQRYRDGHPEGWKLVLMGKENKELTPEDPDIISLGFVSEQDKYDGMAGAEAFILPSKFESLSMVMLESMAVDTPVLVNGHCEVLRDHCIKSNGAFYYNSYPEFEAELDYLFSHPKEREMMCRNAHVYVDKNYRWKIVIEKLSQLIKEVAERSEQDL